MAKILVISTSFAEQEQLESVAKHHNPGSWNIQTTASFGQDAQWWQSSGPDLLLVQLPQDELFQGYFFTKLRKDVPKSQKILFLCPQISASLLQLSTEYARVKLVKTPINAYTLYKAVEDILKEWDAGKKQVHPRYLTDIKIVIRSDFKEGQNDGTMKNLSVSGAYFEVQSTVFSMEPGDFIQLSIPQPNSKQYVFDAKVVWAKKIEDSEELMAEGSGSEKLGIGVAFIDKENVYSNLLKGFAR